MDFKLDYNNTFTSTIDDGTYEVVIALVSEGSTPNGAEYIQFDLIIRNDVDQKFKNMHIFHNVWKSKETGKFNPKSFNTVGKAAQLQDGKQYNSLLDLFNDYIGKTCKVTIKNESSEHNGTTYQNLTVKRWDKSDITGPMNHVFKQNVPPTSTPIDISDDDLPF